MALTGAFLVLFLTFHCLMNAVAIVWPTAYNSICEFLGANWYALLGTVVIAVFAVIHIFYAVWLTLQNRKARMLVLGIVVLAFLVVHFIQFWAKMQMAEIAGTVEALPPAAGTLFLQEAFGQPWTLVVYAVGFVALWFHLTHGFWSMFQSVGWDNKVWMNRLKCIGNWWVSIVVALFLAEAIVFTVRAHEKFYLTDEALREQYKDMIVPMLEEDFGPDADQLGAQIEMSPYGQVSMGLRQMHSQMANQLEQVNTPEGKEMVKGNPEMASQIEELQKRTDALENVVKLFDYLESADNKPENLMPASAGNQPY